MRRCCSCCVLGGSRSAAITTAEPGVQRRFMHRDLVLPGQKGMTCGYSGELGTSQKGSDEEVSLLLRPTYGCMHAQGPQHLLVWRVYSCVVQCSPSTHTHPSPPFVDACAVCPDVPGYTSAVNVDHPGDNIAMASSASTMAARVAATAAACSTDNRCNGFSSGGYTKRAVWVTQQSPGTCLYTRTRECRRGMLLISPSIP